MPAPSTILVIDDEVNLRCTLSMIFTRAGYTVTVAANADEARQCLKTDTFSLIFLDLKMPDVEGFTLIPEIRTLCPDIPVLIMTAHANIESAIEALRQGARDYLLKPVDPALILTRVEEVLAETAQLGRRREIVGEIQGLLARLVAIDPARFLQSGPFTLDLHARHVTCNSQFIPLSQTAFNYLLTLVRHSPDVVSAEILVREAQGCDAGPKEARVVARWRIHELRGALESDPRHPRYIITVRGIGYRLMT